MTRFLALVLLLILVYLLLSALVRRMTLAVRGGGTAPGSVPRQDEGAVGPGEPLVRCAACGVRLPQSRALPSRGATVGRASESYCSEACRREHGTAR